MRKLILLKPKIIVLFICLILFILPFFWIKPGELELGGDSSRLYLYDPGAYLQTTSLYSLQPEGMGSVRPDQNLLPFMLILQFIYSIFHSPYFLTSLLNSLKLVGSFLFVYLIVVEILKNHIKEGKSFYAEMAGILGGLFYTLAPSIGQSMQFALIIHNQVFLNPMIFYLMLRFLVSHKDKYLWFLLLATFIFSPNFSLKAPTAPFSFYPVAFLFLGLYVTLCLKKSLPWKKLAIGIFLFLGLHAFHIIPVAAYTLDSGSDYNLRVFDSASIRNEGLNYFNAILPNAMVVKSFFYNYGVPFTQWTAFVAPLTIILGFLLSKGRQTTPTLIAVFFFITTFLESANITQIGVDFYRTLFYIPGFSMFRNFYGQWQWVQTFFYSLLLGYAFFLIFSKLKKKAIYIASILITVIFIYNSWIFISGDILRKPHRATNNVSTIIEMDPHYEETLSFFRNLSTDGKIFDFPFTEFAYQVLPGRNRGAYIGPSPTSYLTGRRDFSGHIILEPFSGVFLRLIEEKNYDAIKRLFGLLNVKYVFHINDPRAYEEFFPSIPYTLLLKVLPDSKSLTDFVGKVTDGKIFQRGNYFIYNSDSNYYLPHFYVPTTIIPYGDKNGLFGENVSFFVDNKEKDPRIGYVKNDICAKFYSPSDCRQNNIKMNSIPNIGFKRINPTKYKVVVANANTPFFLIFSDKFHKDWRAFISNQEPEKLKVQESYFGGSVQEYNHENIFLDSKTFETLGVKSLPEKQHFVVNGYANAWYIAPTDSDGKDNYEIIVEMVQQRIFYYSLAVSLVSLVEFLLYGLKLIIDKRRV